MLYLEDLEVGQTFRSREYEITEENLVAFASQFDPQPFHLRHEEAEGSFFGGLASSGWQVGSVTMLLLTESLPIASGIIGGGVDLRWVSPTRPGDRLHIEVEVQEVTPSRSKPDRGVVTIFVKTLNQHDDLRQSLSSSLLVFRSDSKHGTDHATPQP